MDAVRTDATLFEDAFTITDIDDQKYARAARLTSTSLDGQCSLELDFPTELFPLRVGEGIQVVLATSLKLDGSRDDDDEGGRGGSGTDTTKGWRDVTKGGPGAAREASLADNYEYVCYGKVYNFEKGDNGQTMKAYASFGGLLMCLSGPLKKLTPLTIDNVYLLATR